MSELHTPQEIRRDRINEAVGFISAVCGLSFAVLSKHEFDAGHDIPAVFEWMGAAAFLGAAVVSQIAHHNFRRPDRDAARKQKIADRLADRRRSASLPNGISYGIGGEPGSSWPTTTYDKGYYDDRRPTPDANPSVNRDPFAGLIDPYTVPANPRAHETQPPQATPPAGPPPRFDPFKNLI